MCEDDRRLDDYFEIFKDLIIRYAKSYVGDYYIAEDICQETFIRFGEHQDEIRESSAKFWLMKTAKNIALALPACCSTVTVIWPSSTTVPA